MLDNTAKIGDIVTALQSVQGINQKADLKSALVTKGVDALDTDNVAELISRLNTANLVLDGRKWASGTVTSSSTQLNFQYASSTTTNNQYSITVTGLTFLPSFIIISEVNAETITIYRNNGYNYGKIATIAQAGGAGTTGSIGTYKADYSPASITGTGFTLPFLFASKTCNWIAFE